jgi:hypothetical protein
MRNGYGYPALTADIKRMMLSDTQARIANLDIQAMRKQCKGDEFDQLDSLGQPWSSGKDAK